MANIPQELLEIEKSLAPFWVQILKRTVAALDFRSGVLDLGVQQMDGLPGGEGEVVLLKSKSEETRAMLRGARVALKELETRRLPDVDGSIVKVEVRDADGRVIPGLRVRMREERRRGVVTSGTLTEEGELTLLVKREQLGDPTAPPKLFVLEVLDRSGKIVATHAPRLMFTEDNVQYVRMTLSSEATPPNEGLKKRSGPRKPRAAKKKP